MDGSASEPAHPCQRAFKHPEGLGGGQVGVREGPRGGAGNPHERTHACPPSTPHTPLRLAPTQASAYRQRILEAVPPELSGTFDPIMTLYLTDRWREKERSLYQRSSVLCGVSPPAKERSLIHSTPGVRTLRRTTPEAVHAAKAAGIPAFKLYPAGEGRRFSPHVCPFTPHSYFTLPSGATTNSDSGVTDIVKVLPALRYEQVLTQCCAR